MSKVNTGQAPSTLIPKYIGSDFDKVVSVADSIEQVVVVSGSVEDVGTVADNINYVKEVAEDLHGMPVTMYTGENPPVLNPMPEGVMWYCTTDGRTYVWYTDADSGQWVESAPQSAMKDEATNIFLHSVPSNVNPAYRSATLYSTPAPEAEISVAHNALNTPVVQAQFIREEALWVDVSVTGAQGIVTLMAYSSGGSQLKAEIITWKNGAEGTSLGASQWVTLPSQPSVVSLPVTLANIDVLDAGDSYVVKLTSQMNSGSSAISTILVDGNTSSRFGIIFNTNLIGLFDGIRDGVTTSAPTENAVYDALQLKVGKSQLVQSGNLTSTANWANVPAYSDSELGGSGGPLNAQAKALTARSELLLTDVREALRRSYAEAGYSLVDGSFEVGGTLVNANDVLLHEASGKAFTGPAGTVPAGTNPASGGFVDRSGVLLRQAVSTVIQVDPFILLAPRVIDGLHNARDYIASIGGGVGILSAKVYLLEDEYIPVDRVIMRGQGNGPSFGGATTLKWAGGAGAGKAVVRSSKYPLGTEGSLALSGVGVQNCVIDADGCDIGLYSYYTTNNSDFDGIVTRNATIANTYIIKSWFTKYGDQQARDGKNRGIVIGKALFGETGDIAVNACGWGWMQCKSNGTSISSYDPAGLSDVGAGLVLGTFVNSNHFPSVQSEGNNGVGVHSAVSFTNSFGSVYLESNSGASSGEKCAWTNISGGSLTAISVQTTHLATGQTIKNNVGRGMIIDVIHRGDNINTFTGTGELVVRGGNLTSFSATDWTKVAKTHTQLLSAQNVNVRYTSVVQGATRFLTHAALSYPQVTVVPRATVTLSAALQIGIDSNTKQNYGTAFTANVPVTLRHAAVVTPGVHTIEVGGTLPTVDTFFDIYLTIPLLAGSGLQSPAI